MPQRKQGVNPRPEDDPMVVAALEEGRHADDIWIIECRCGTYSYYNQGSHADCRSCGRNLTAEIEEAITIADFWTAAPYPNDELIEPRRTS